MFSWSELLADAPWLEAHWVPVAGGAAGERALPDAQHAALQGRGSDVAAPQRLATFASASVPASAARFVALGLYMIR